MCNKGPVKYIYPPQHQPLKHLNLYSFEYSRFVIVEQRCLRLYELRVLERLRVSAILVLSQLVQKPKRNQCMYIGRQMIYFVNESYTAGKSMC